MRVRHVTLLMFLVALCPFLLGSATSVVPVTGFKDKGYGFIMSGNTVSFSPSYTFSGTGRFTLTVSYNGTLTSSNPVTGKSGANGTVSLTVELSSFKPTGNVLEVTVRNLAKIGSTLVAKDSLIFGCGYSVSSSISTSSTCYGSASYLCTLGGKLSLTKNKYEVTKDADLINGETNRFSLTPIKFICSNEGQVSKNLFASPSFEFRIYGHPDSFPIGTREYDGATRSFYISLKVYCMSQFSKGMSTITLYFPEYFAVSRANLSMRKLSEMRNGDFKSKYIFMHIGLEDSERPYTFKVIGRIGALGDLFELTSVYYPPTTVFGQCYNAEYCIGIGDAR